MPIAETFILYNFFFSKNEKNKKENCNKIVMNLKCFLSF